MAKLTFKIEYDVIEKQGNNNRDIMMEREIPAWLSIDDLMSEVLRFADALGHSTNEIRKAIWSDAK